jgi:hypothetical protein
MPINNQCLRLHQHIIGKSFLQRENKSEESERERAFQESKKNIVVFF